MDVLRWPGFVLGIAIVVATLTSLIVSLVVPRSQGARMPRAVERLVRAVFLRAAGLFDDYERKDRTLGFQAPVTLLALLATWMFALLIGFGLLLWPLTTDFPEALREAGSSLLTLGFSAQPTAAAAAVYFLAAASGLVVVALLIAYLPAIYSSFNRREVLVTTLQGRAGAPAWGPEILARHQLVGLLGNLPDFYADWERWAADVAESHSNYPLLISFRSPHPLRSWVVGLLAVLDSAALYLSLCPAGAPMQARLCLRMGFISLRELASAAGLPYDPDPYPDDPIELTFEEFASAVERLRAGGFEPEVPAEEAWPHFRGWRVNYEQVSYALADYTVAPPGPWSGSRRHLPGMAIVPQRPVNRRPDDDKQRQVPKMERPRWRV